VQNYYPYSFKHEDITHGILQHFFLQQKRPPSLIIKNELAQRYIYPNFFRSMKYECYLYVYIHFKNGLFATIPIYRSVEQLALLKKGWFLIFVKSNPHDMFTAEDRELELIRQNRIFVSRFRMTSKSNPEKSKLIVVYETYFFCLFCPSGLVRVNSTNRSISSLSLSSFEKIWAPELAKHHYQVYYESEA